MAPGLASGLTSGFASELEAGVEFRFSQLRLGLELAARLAAVLGLHWELIFASRIEIDAAPGFTLIVTLGFASRLCNDPFAELRADLQHRMLKSSPPATALG